jgi:hypothetical protein
VSVALTRPAPALYHEEQNFAWWLYAALASMVALAALGIVWHDDAKPGQTLPPASWTKVEVPLYLVIGFGLPTVLVACVLHMTTEVDPNACRVWFGWLPTYRRIIPLSEIARIEVVRYHAFRDHGFWGVHTGRDGERALTARGDCAVRLHLRDGTRVLIGTQRPDELAGVLERERLVPT